MKLLRILALASVAAALAAPVSARAQGSDTARKSVSTKAATSKGTKTTAKHMAMPTKATAMCGDSTWSSAASQQGACSNHAGVAKWFGTAPKDATARCKDGEYWTSGAKQGACSGHGGVAFRMKAHKA